MDLENWQVNQAADIGMTPMFSCPDNIQSFREQVKSIRAMESGSSDDRSSNLSIVSFEPPQSNDGLAANPGDRNGGVIVDSEYRASKIFQTIVSRGGLGNQQFQDGIRDVFNAEMGATAGDARRDALQEFVDRINRQFEDNNRDGLMCEQNIGPFRPNQFYFGVASEGNELVLYSPRGAHTLDLRTGR